MGRLIHLRGDPHEETQRLLPWYATGQLDAADRMLVDAHLATCHECREELAVERRLGAAIRDLPLVADDPWERFQPRLEPRAEDRRWWRQPVRVAWFAAAQAAVVLLCVGIGVVTYRHVAAPPPTQSAPAYHALGDAATAPVGNMIVMFAPGTPAAAIRGAIAAQGASIVRGPTEAGAYVAAVAPADRAAALARLSARRDVTLAQPIDAPTP